MFNTIDKLLCTYRIEKILEDHITLFVMSVSVNKAFPKKYINIYFSTDSIIDLENLRQNLPNIFLVGL